MAGQLGIKTETTVGTAVTPDIFVPILSATQRIDEGYIRSNGIRAGRRTRTPARLGARAVGGSVRMELHNGSIATLLKHAFGAVSTTGAGPYCVDTETEILTVAGWKRYDEIGAGTIVRTLNHETGLAEWQPIESMHIFPAEPRELVRMVSRDHSSLTTPNHRWPVEAFRHRTGEFKRIWKTSETLAAADRLIKAAPSADQPQEQKWSDDLVELVAWFYTEGTITKSSTIGLCQSHKVNADLCDRIAGVLRRMFGEPSDSLAYEARMDRPRWAFRVEDRNMRYRLNKSASDLLLAVSPDKVPTFEWLRDLTTAQLHLFLNVSLMADGDGAIGAVRTPRMGQTDVRRAEAFQFAAVLAGFGTSMRPRSNGQYDDQHVVSLHAGTRTAIVAAAKKGDTASIERVTHDGIVWCPKTANASWLARRDGAVYFTGNTHTFTPGAHLGKSFTLQLGIEDTAGTVNPFTFSGCKMNSWAITAAVGGLAEFSFDFSAKDVVTATALATASYSTLTPFSFVEATTKTVNGADVASANAVTYSCSKGLRSDRHTLGSRTIREQLEKDKFEFMTELAADFDALTLFNLAVAATQVASVLALSNGTESLTITSSGQVVGDPPSLENHGIEPQTIRLDHSHASADASTITGVLIDSEASAA